MSPDAPPRCTSCKGPLKRTWLGLGKDLQGGTCALCDGRVCRGCLNKRFLVRPGRVLAKHRGAFSADARRERPYPVCVRCFNDLVHH